jgi:hypothetical protein
MTTIARTSTGYRAETSNAVSFENRVSSGRIRPAVGLHFLCDKLASRQIWLPHGEACRAEIDTAVSVSCMGSLSLLRLGIAEDSSDPAFLVDGVDRRRAIKGRRKFVWVRVAGTPPAMRLSMEIRYSRDFPEDLLLISWNWIRDYFDVLVLRDLTYLFW